MNIDIEALDLTTTSSAPPVKAVFGSVTILLTTVRVRSRSSAMIFIKLTPIQDSIINELDGDS